MTRADFEERSRGFVSKTDQSLTLSIAFDFFVLGHTTATLSKRHNCTPNNVRRAIHRFKKHLERGPISDDEQITAKNTRRPKLTAEVFDAVLPWFPTRASTTIELARLYFVTGLSASEVARRFQMTPPNVGTIINRFMKAYDIYKEAEANTDDTAPTLTDESVNDPSYFDAEPAALPQAQLTEIDPLDRANGRPTLKPEVFEQILPRFPHRAESTVEVVRLYFVHGMKASAIARHFKMTAPNVGMILSRFMRAYDIYKEAEKAAGTSTAHDHADSKAKGAPKPRKPS